MALECPEGSRQPKVSSFVPYSGDISSDRTPVRFCSVCVRGPMLIRSPFFFANPARIGRLQGTPTSDESFIFLLGEELSRPEAG
jgi:hypothetical protein